MVLGSILGEPYSGELTSPAAQANTALPARPVWMESERLL